MDWTPLAAYGGIGLATVLDHSGIPLPLVAAAAAAGPLGLELPWILVAGTAGSVVGDLALAVGGRFVGRDVLRHRFLRRILGHLPERFVASVTSRPVRALMLYRFVPAVGKYAPFAAIAGGLSLGRTMALCSLGSIAYVLVYGSLGAILGEAFVGGLDLPRRLIVIAVILGLLWLAWHARRKAPTPVAGSARPPILLSPRFRFGSRPTPQTPPSERTPDA